MFLDFFIECQLSQPLCSGTDLAAFIKLFLYQIILSGRGEEFRTSFETPPRNGLRLYIPQQRPIHSRYVSLALTTQTLFPAAAPE